MIAYRALCPPPPFDSFFACRDLQDITVLANSKEEALEIAQVWADENEYEFSRPMNLSDIEVLSQDVSVPGVIDYTLSSSY